MLLASDIMHGQLGVLDQTCLDVVRASQDSEQAGIGWCLVIGILDQHSHFATDGQADCTVNLRRSSGALVGA